jgi:hypothetical protein
MGANMILTIGAILLFGVFLKTSNQLMIGNNQIAETNEYYVSALAIGQSVIDEAKTKSFDEQTIGLVNPVASPATLTAVNAMASEGGGENVPNPDTLTATGWMSAVRFDDVDDYNGYRRKVNTARAEGYFLSATVAYATETNPEVAAAVKSFCKRMNVKVWSRYIPDTLKLSYAFTY